MNRWQSFSFYMPNARPEIVHLQAQVFAALDEPLTQVEDTCSHGQFLTRTLRENADRLEAVVFFDLDCIPLKPGVVERAVAIALGRNVVIGCAQQSNHLERAKILQAQRAWPSWRRGLARVHRRIRRFFGFNPFHFVDPRVYAGPCFLVVPSNLYRQAGFPTLVETERADVAEELTIACREHGISVRCLTPTSCVEPRYEIGNVKRYGIGTVYGRCVFHAFETTYLNNSQSAKLFIARCHEVIARFGSPALDSGSEQQS